MEFKFDFKGFCTKFVIGDSRKTIYRTDSVMIIPRNMMMGKLRVVYNLGISVLMVLGETGRFSKWRTSRFGRPVVEVLGLVHGTYLSEPNASFWIV